MGRTWPGGTAGDVITSNVAITTTQISWAIWFNYVTCTNTLARMIETSTGTGTAGQAIYIVNTPTNGPTLRYEHRATGTNGPFTGNWWATLTAGPGLWHQLVVSHDCSGATMTALPLFWVDGIQQTVVLQQAASGSQAFDIQLNIGNTDTIPNVANGTRTWNGQLAELGVWNTILSATDVWSLQGTSPIAVRPSSLLGYYPILGTVNEPDGIGHSTTTVSGTTTYGHPGQILKRTPLASGI